MADTVLCRQCRLDFCGCCCRDYLYFANISLCIFDEAASGFLLDGKFLEPRSDDTLAALSGNLEKQRTSAVQRIAEPQMMFAGSDLYNSYCRLKASARRKAGLQGASAAAAAAAASAAMPPRGQSGTGAWPAFAGPPGQPGTAQQPQAQRDRIGAHWQGSHAWPGAQHTDAASSIFRPLKHALELDQAVCRRSPTYLHARDTVAMCHSAPPRCTPCRMLVDMGVSDVLLSCAQASCTYQAHCVWSHCSWPGSMCSQSRQRCINDGYAMCQSGRVPMHQRQRLCASEMLAGCGPRLCSMAKSCDLWHLKQCCWGLLT